jgi:hypothetical protein
MDNRTFAIQIGAASIIGFGVMFWLFAVAYSGDIVSFTRAPQQIWQFVCGIPSQNSLTVPLLLSIGTIAVISGSGTLWWQRQHR